MRTTKLTGWAAAGLLGLLVVGSTVPADAEIASDRAAAVIHYPLVEVEVNPPGAEDTVIEISNTGSDPVRAHCFYMNANSHCSNDGTVCEDASQCCDGQTCGICEPGWNEIDFDVILTPNQPLSWVASEGRRTFPIDGVTRRGVRGSSNAGSRVPPVPELPFRGSLTCVAVDDRGDPIDDNVLVGIGSLEYDGTSLPLDVAKYNAVGMRALEGRVDSDHELVIGGADPEYEGCPNVLVLNHFFEFVDDPVTGETINTELVLVPCSNDLLRQAPGSAVVQYLVFNEFEQRFSTSRRARCQQVIRLSEIDTTQETRSIFHAGVSGTVTGQTRLTPIGSGMMGIAVETHGERSASFNLHFQGERAAADLITLP